MTADRSRIENRAVLAFTALACVYFGALLLLSLVQVRVFTVDGQALQIALIVFGLPLAMANMFVLWHGSRLLASDLAYRDDLTGLYNRRAFMKKAEDSLRGARAGSVALALFDIDGLKGINDSCGHQAGDEMIRYAASNLSRVAGGSLPIYRIGGDEFAAVVERPAGERVSRMFPGLRPFDARFQTCGHIHTVGVSFGVASCMEGERLDSLFRRADERMYGSKGAARADLLGARLAANGSKSATGVPMRLLRLIPRD